MIQARRDVPDERHQRELRLRDSTVHSSQVIDSPRSTCRIIWFCARNGTASIHSWFLTGSTISNRVGTIGRNMSTGR